MKLIPLLCTVAAIAIGSIPTISLAYVKNEITQVDASAGSLTVSNGRGGYATYRTTPATEILLNGVKADLASLAPGMTAMVASASGDASRIVATTGSKPTGGDDAGVVLKEAKFTVPAASSRTKPVIVGSVKAGQQVTITPIRVHWSGGGSKKGVYCDWNGYPGKRDSGHTWMALVASVGKSTFAPKDNALSFTVPADGLLALYANDDSPEDNVGSGEVTVTVAPK
jgi:hypothetical protein